MKLFLDSDVLLDIALGRMSFCESSAKVVALLENDRHKGYTSPIVFINIFYVLQKAAGAEIARSFLQRLEKIISVLPTNGDMIHNALYSDFSDFEDAAQYFTACQIDMDYIVTRNAADYANAHLPVASPDEFLSMQPNASLNQQTD